MEQLLLLVSCRACLGKPELTLGKSLSDPQYAFNNHRLVWWDSRKAASVVTVSVSSLSIFIAFLAAPRSVELMISSALFSLLLILFSWYYGEVRYAKHKCKFTARSPGMTIHNRIFNMSKEPCWV